MVRALRISDKIMKILKIGAKVLGKNFSAQLHKYHDAGLVVMVELKISDVFE